MGRVHNLKVHAPTSDAAELERLRAEFKAELAALRAAFDRRLAPLERYKAGLDTGRAKRNAERRAAAGALRDVVLGLAAADADAGRPARGRAGRIARKINRGEGSVSEAHVRKILRALSSARDSLPPNANLDNGEEPDPHGPTA